MAKSKSFFGLRTGSTKSLTFQVYRGQQVTKDRVYRVSNPRSEAQMKQRALIPIVAASRAALKGLVDHSFEGVAYGDASLKKFSELNLRAGALDVLSYSPNGVSNPGFATLQVSAGSLSMGADVTLANDKKVVIYLVNTAGKNELKFPAAAVGAPATPILKAIADWGATDCAYVAGGNQLTFLTVSNIGNVQIGNNSAPLSRFGICRLLFPSSETSPSQIDNVNSAFRVTSQVTEGASEVHMSNGSFSVGIKYFHGGDMGLHISIRPNKDPAGSSVVGGTVIRSALVNNVWKRSIANIEFPNGTTGEDYTYEMWRSYYESTGVSAKYLNQGDEGTGIQG